MDDSPSLNIPNPPSQKGSYKQGLNTYLNLLPKVLRREMGARNTYDPQRIQEQQHLQATFGPTQYAQMLRALQLIDPTGYNLREQTGNALAGDLAAGTHLTADQSQELEQQIRRSQAARGNAYGQAPVQAEAFTKGQAGLNLYQQRLANAMQFQNSATPQQWAAAIPPVSPDRSMAYVNPNAGFQGQQFALQNFQNQVAAANPGGGGGSNPWMSGLGAVASIVGPILGGMAFSDVRLKSDIKRVGTTPAGLGLYRYKIQEPQRTEVGVLAQEVAQKQPEAVATDPETGFLQVNYGAIR